MADAEWRNREQDAALRFFGGIYRVPRPVLHNRMCFAVEMAGLAGRENMLVSTLRRSMTVADAITATLVSCTEHVRANIPGAKRGEDPEALHQLRVGVRRLRAALSAYREAMPPGERRAVSRAFRQFERNLSPARDWDVLIEKYGKAGRGDREKRDLIERAEAQRAEAHRRLANMISQTPISRLLKRAQQLVHGKRAMSASRTPIRDFAGEVLDQRDRRARKLGRTNPTCVE